MKLTITKLNENLYAYVEEGKDEILLDEKSIVLEKKTDIYWLKLPENPLNRKLVSTKKFAENPVVILENVKTPIKIGEKSPKKNWTEYLNDEEKEMYERLKKNAEERMRLEKEEEEKKKNDPIEKAKKKVNSIIENLKNLGMSDESILELISQK
jgi:hypothetical protein